MSLLHSLRRATLAVAATGLLAGGAVAVATASSASAAGLPLIALNNDTAEVGTDCPDDGAAYWHFVLAPNDGSSAFTAVFLRLATGPGTYEDLTFSGAALIPNEGRTDNIFVAVPEGHELTDLVKIGSQAGYSGNTPNQFNLSHVCEGEVPTTPTTRPTTPTTEAPTTSTTEVEVLGAVQATSTTQAEVLGAVQVNGELPYTGSETTGLAVAGVAIAGAGAALVALARSRARRTVDA